jgi:hypothetical protein
MSVADPLTINGITFNRIDQGDFGSEFFSRVSTHEDRLSVKHSTEKALQYGTMPIERHLVKHRRTTFATATDPEYWVEAYMVIRLPRPYSVGGVLAPKTVIRALIDDQNPTTTNLLTQVIGWES